MNRKQGDYHTKNRNEWLPVHIIDINILWYHMFLKPTGLFEDRRKNLVPNGKM